MDGHQEILDWFCEFQRNRVLKNGIIPEWFHGIISRKKAEELLSTRPRGYFLIRVSESRIGYTLSYRVDDRCRHFMIDILPGEHYVIVGEKTKHRSLHDLVAFHRRTPILPYSELLTVACGQASKENSDYSELFFSSRNTRPGADIQPSVSTQPSVPGDSHPAPATCPSFPNQGISPSISSAASPCLSPKLYPCLETELAVLTLQKTAPSPQPQKLRATHTLPPPPSQMPPRGSCLTQSPAPVDEKKGLPVAYVERPLPSPQPEKKEKDQKSQAEGKPLRISLAQCKKVFQKKKQLSQEHTYQEIHENAIGNEPAFTASEHQELSRDRDPEPESESTVEDGALPVEYFNPPPFAPGY
ncbi:hematopoietic SH2 domain-containing protein homolog [Hoplias malabaricus]|uniref:hematopoietic SH2 domain-containing protein homolog n=1 Tax=Hoplias malabaricus TaxID=27720 RepID=UPI003461ABC1